MQKAESRQVIHRTFAGSLPQFIAAFLYGRKISDSEAEKIDRIIDSYREDK
jgi:predicted transcriptional regulator